MFIYITAMLWLSWAVVSFDFLGPFLRKMILKFIFPDCNAIKMTIYCHIFIIILCIFLLIFKAIKIKTFSWASKSNMGLHDCVCQAPWTLSALIMLLYTFSILNNE